MKKIANILQVFIAAMAALGLSGCAREELSMPDIVEEGVPITVTLNLSGTSTSDIVVDTKASGSDLSEISDLVVFIFHGDGTFEDVVTNYHGITTLTVNSNEVITDKSHLYNVTFNTTSGTKKLLAVANVAEGGYWGKVIDILTVAYQDKASFDVVKSEIVSLREDLADGTQPFHITASSQMFISGWNEDVVFGANNTVTDYGTYGDAANYVAVKMYRAMANITFNITDNATENPDGAQGTFTPTSFRVYNVPFHSYLINDIQTGDPYKLTTDIDNPQITYINTGSENIGTAQGGKYTFDFYMPENIQAAGTGISSYEDRDVWDSDANQGAKAEDKQWTNAPQNSTFVVITGTYEGNANIDGNPGQPVTANVEYTVHLGDFSSLTGDVNNFSVERNVSYTYNITVLGVDKIIVEAKKEGGENQPGAEGSVYDRSNTKFSYNLDAHYEQVYLEYNLSEIVRSLRVGLSGQDLDDAIADQLILIIQSEMMSYTHDETPDAPYTTRNNRGTLSPYKIYADAVRGKSGQDADNAAATAKSNVLDGAGEGAAPTKGFDYKWIEFLPQKEENTISPYPGISKWAMENLDGMTNRQFYAGATGNDDMLDVYDVIVEMGKAIKQIYKGETPSSSKITISSLSNGNHVARFTAFVNEYYYLRHPLTGVKATSWSRMTNKIPREMIIAMSTETSTDGNSSYSKIHSYITQLSMQTFYNDQSASLNAFGIETYNETPLYEFGNTNSPYGLSDNDGRENQKILIEASSTPKWEKYINASKNGWTSSVGTDNPNHKLMTDAYNIKAAYSACMSRNRDLNGDGKINENEIRWFLASVNEYIRMDIGANAISSAAQLYIGDKTTMVKANYPNSYIADGSLFYTSSYGYYWYSSPSNGNKQVYWAIEKGSYGAIGSYYDGSALPIRCIRNLPASDATTDISSIDGVKSDATYEMHSASGNTPIVLEFKDRLVPGLYRQRVQGSLDIHNEDDDANKFYEGIFVADHFIRTENAWQGYYTYTTYALGDIIGYDGTVSWDGGSYSNDGTMTNPCASYTQDGYDNWRVPNLVELSAMNAAGLLSKPASNSNNDVACCTQFTNQSVRYGFAFSSLIYCPGDDVSQINNQVLIRCVRDVPPEYEFPTN